MDERAKFQQQIAQLDVEQDDDPLEVYWKYIQWLDRNHDDTLVDVLEEATKLFLHDDHFKTDLRYLKIWVMYARRIEDPASVYSHLIANNIGTTYALLYEEYADLLEKSGSLHQAEELYRKGIHRRARPSDRLKAKYDKFQSRNPLKNAPNPGHNRYAPMLARPVPGKRPEKLRLDLSLIFTKEGVEYSIQEARARSMGLLTKKWPPPAPTELDLERQNKVRVDFNEDDTKTHRPGRKSLLPTEPTVTLATKEALADVFGMYNSPEKSMRYGIVPGSKHAPVHTVKIIPRLPFSQSHIRELSNNSVPAKSQSFTPFVDENLRQETKSAVKFQPYVDPDLQPRKTPTNPSKSTTFTPFVDENLRQEPKPAARFKPFVDTDLKSSTSSRKTTHTFNPFVDENAPKSAVKFQPYVDPESPLEENSHAGPSTRPSSSRTPSENSAAKPAAVFSKVFTPAPSRDQPPTFRPPPGRNTTFTPLRDPVKQPPSFKVFSRPTDQDENTPRTFRPKLGSENQRTVFAEEEEDGIEEDEDEEEIMELRTPGASDENQNPSYRPRYAADIDIMTPIAERTFEVTTTTTGMLPSAFKFRMEDASVAALQLAAELRQEEEQEEQEEEQPQEWDPREGQGYPMEQDEYDEEDEGHFTTDDPMVQDRTSTLSLYDAMDIASSFKPPNPCTPFDPAIVDTLLSLAPANTTTHDLRAYPINQLAALNKFCKRHGSATEPYPLRLGERDYEVVGKLGEGGFGAVFSAKDITLLESEDYYEEEEDSNPMVAIKVVSPSNLWEHHILHTIHTSIPTPLVRASIITPHELYAYADESYLILEQCTHGTLLELVNRVHEINVGQKGGCLDELLVIFFTVELLRFTEAMHARGFIHGDLKIDNCLLRLEHSTTWANGYQAGGAGGWSAKGLKIIDFGRTIDTRQFPSHPQQQQQQQFVADWPVDGKDCREMREGRPWTYQPDYFGMAGIVYCMLYGKHLEDSGLVETSVGAEKRLKLGAGFRRYWQVEMWTEFFDVLLNPTTVRPGGELPLCDELGRIRVKFEEWLKRNDKGVPISLKGLLKKVAIASERG